ncbi:unnamed protein product [Adineta ricciae]|uniref:Uncharacterized protein n=1 Tax=Adineta ricciae TaxID=249248 RepID=A0A816G1S1_ADIRI|nr:unnamed protein product [Adineta ricciae]
MYAANDDEDWVYLHQTPPVHTISRGRVNLTARRRANSSSSSSITSCSSQSNRSVSLSSICSTELEQAQNDDHTINNNVLPTSINTSLEHSALDQENSLLESTNIEETVLFLRLEQATQTSSDTVEVQTQSSQTLPFTHSIVYNSKPQRRRSTGALTQRTEFRRANPRRSSQRFDSNDTFISCTCIMVLLIFSFILGQIVAQWDQSTMKRISKELDRTNQRLNEVQDIPIENIEEKLTKQLEDKLQNLVNQQLAWHDYERNTFVRQIRELRQVLNMTQQNLTNKIHRMTKENDRLQERIKSLEHRTEKKHPQVLVKDDAKCRNTSGSTLDRFVSNVFKQTMSITTNTSMNFSGFFEHLSASVTNFVDSRYEYMNKSKEVLGHSSTTEKLQISLRKSVESLSSSFRKARLTYSSWRKLHVQHREPYPWGWPCRYDEDRCYSKFESSMNKIRSMKNWMIKMFRA